MAAPVVGAVGLAGATGLLWLAVRWLIRLEEPLGEGWYAVYRYAGRATLALLGMIAVLAGLHLWRRGREDIRPQGPGDALRWWPLWQRGLHWAFVLSFVVLLVTGVQLYYAGFGLPTPLTRAMRGGHAGEPFMVLGAALFLAWCRDAWPRRYDLHWLRRLGGYLDGGRHAGRDGGGAAPPPAGRFNAGQKLWFWLEALTGLVMALTGYQLQHHFSRLDDGYLTLLALHLAAAVVFLVVLAVHFYLAVVGVRGALGGMIHGRIGRAGAARLHSQADALRRPGGP